MVWIKFDLYFLYSKNHLHMDIILKMIWYLSNSSYLDKIKEFLSISSVSRASLNRMIHRLDKNRKKGEYKMKGRFI